jgi:hypothetical protein
MTKEGDEFAIGLLGASLGALIELVSECRTAITERWDVDHEDTINLVERIDAFLGPIADGCPDRTRRQP